MQFNLLALVASTLISTTIAAKPTLTHPTGHRTLAHTGPAIEFHKMPERPDPQPWEIMPYNATEHGPADSSIHKRGVAGIYLCANGNWGGPCQWSVSSGGLCHRAPYGDMLSGSVGPDHGIYCQFWQDYNCQDPGIYHNPYHVTYPGWHYRFGDGSEALTNESFGHSYRCHWL